MDTTPYTLDPAGTRREGLSSTTEDPGLSNVSITKWRLRLVTDAYSHGTQDPETRISLRTWSQPGLYDECQASWSFSVRTCHERKGERNNGGAGRGMDTPSMTEICTIKHHLAEDIYMEIYRYVGTCNIGLSVLPKWTNAALSTDLTTTLPQQDAKQEMLMTPMAQPHHRLCLQTYNQTHISAHPSSRGAQDGSWGDRYFPKERLGFSNSNTQRSGHHIHGREFWGSAIMVEETEN